MLNFHVRTGPEGSGFPVSEATDRSLDDTFRIDLISQLLILTIDSCNMFYTIVA